MLSVSSPLRKYAKQLSLHVAFAQQRCFHGLHEPSSPDCAKKHIPNLLQKVPCVYPYQQALPPVTSSIQSSCVKYTNGPLNNDQRGVAAAAALQANVRRTQGWKVDKKVMDHLSRTAQLTPQGMPLEGLYEFGSQAKSFEAVLTAARWMHRELPIRLARCVKMIDRLPTELVSKHSVQAVRSWYIQSFSELKMFPTLKTEDQEKDFTGVLRIIFERHNLVQETMAQGVQELRRDSEGLLTQDVTEFLTKFYLARIGIRTLIAQHMALHDPKPGFAGIIQTDCNPASIAQDAADAASMLCTRVYGDSPEIMILGMEDLSFHYVPDHLYIMLFELLKNSLRAEVEFHGVDNPLPPVRLVISGGDEDVAIKVSDEGGGIPRSAVPLLFSFFYTTAHNPVEIASTSPQDTPIAGYGFGLPISRLYARFFGGDLTIMPMEGYGCDAYLHLKKVGDTQEPVP